MGTLISVLGLMVSLGLLVYLAFRGYSVIIIAPIVVIIAIVSSSGFDSHLMANYTEVYMAGFAGYVKKYFALYLLGAIFAKLMEESGYAASIANLIIKKLGKERAVLSVVLACAILTYGGVSLFVVAFVVLPIAVDIFMEADIPKRFMPAAIALGSLTFTMTALPGSPQVQNTIPMAYFGTDAFAAPVLGLIAATIMFGLGMLWLNRRVSEAKATGENYGQIEEDLQFVQKDNLPSIMASSLPIIIILVVNLIMARIIYPALNPNYLDKYNTTFAAVSGTWSVLVAMIVSITYLIITQFKKLKDIKGNMKTAAYNCLAPLINSCAVVGFGSVVRGLAIFSIVQAFIIQFSSGNVLLTELLAVNLLCGMTASASGGLGVALEALAPMLIKMGDLNGVTPEVMHRVASVSAGGLDSLPQNGATITTLALCKQTHKTAYFDMFMVSVVFPIISSIIIVVLASLGLQM